MVNRSLEIQQLAKKQLWEAYKYISKDSLQNAKKVINKIIDSFNELIKYPERHPLDKYCRHNDGNYRAYEVYSYRISYYVTIEKIIIIRIRHTKMNPLNY